MSLFRLPKLRGIASRVGHLRNRFVGRDSTRSVSERVHRRLLIDPLETRQLLSVSPAGPTDHLVNESFIGDVGTEYEVYNLTTLAGQSVAVDDDGDFVVTWTRYDYVLDATGARMTDPINGGYLTDSNIYARYFTDEVQRVTLPSALATDNVAGQYGRFSLSIGGPEIQKLTISSLSEPYLDEMMFSSISGTFSVGFDVNGNGSIGAGERFTMVYDEWNMQGNEDMMQTGLRGLGGALADVVVACPSPQEFYIYFGDQSGGLDQPEIVIDPAFTNWSTGFLPSAIITTIREPVLVENIPVHSADPFATALVMEQMFRYSTKDCYQGPTEFPTEEEVPGDTGDNSYDYEAYSEPDTVRYADYRVSVTPTIDPATGNYSLTTFDITFVKESGKTNIPEMVVVKADDDLGTSHLDPVADYVATIKEPSAEFRVNDPEPDDPFTPWPDKTDQWEPAVAMDADGDFVITWASEVGDDASTSDIFARRFSPAGYVDNPAFVMADGTEIQSVVPLGNAFRVNTVTNGPQDQPAIGMDRDGNFTIVWSTTAQDLSYFNQISGQRFNRDGDRIGSEFIASNTGATNTITNVHYEPYVSMNDDGYILVTWSETSDPDILDEPYYDTSGAAVAVWARLMTPDLSGGVSWVAGGGGASTSAWDSEGGFLIGYEILQDTDHIPTPVVGESGGIYVKMYDLVIDEHGAALYQLRNEFRANSASLNAGTRTLWSGEQFGHQVMLDADGDIAVVYEGFGADSSEYANIWGSYYTNLINSETNADLLPFFDPFVSNVVPIIAEHGGSDNAGDIDSEIEYVLAQAYMAGATDDQVGRLGVILNEIAGLLRGESSGVFFSTFDAAANTEPNELTSDCVVHAQRDGENARYIIQIDGRSNSGGFTVDLYHGMTGRLIRSIPIAPVFAGDPLVVEPDRTTQAIEAALQAALYGDMVSWPEGPEPVDYEGTVSVRRIDGTNEFQNRRFTPFYWPQDQTYNYVYEVTFLGDAHDMYMSLSLNTNSLRRPNPADPSKTVKSDDPVINAYSYGNDGEWQTMASAGMQPDADFVVAWSQLDEGTSGYTAATNIYFREFDEPADNAGPNVTDFLTRDGYRLTDGGQIIDTVNYIIVTFDEKLATSGTHSVTNLANWALTKDGVQLSGGISKIYFGMNMSTTLGLTSVGSNKWEAVLLLDGNGVSAGTPALGGGTYQIIASNAIRDAAAERNPLGSTGYNPQGASVTRSFYVVPPTGTETLVNTPTAGNQIALDATTDPSTTPNSPHAIAGDADGEYVVVWKDEGATPGIRARVYRTEWTGTATSRVSNTVVRQDILVTADPTAEYASVARDADGDFVVTWSQYDSTGGTGWNVWYRRYDAMGRPQDVARMANVETDLAQRYSSVALDNDGDFIIAWQSEGQDGSGYGVYAQQYSRSGEIVGGTDEVQLVRIYGDITIATFTLDFDGQVTGPITFTGDLEDTAAQIKAALAALAVPVLVETEALNDTDIAIQFVGEHGRRDVAPLVLNSSAVAGDGEVKIVMAVEGISSEFRVNNTTVGNQLFASVAMDAAGNAVVTWTSFGQDGDLPYQSNIYAKRFASAEILVGSTSGAAKSTSNASPVSNACLEPLIVAADDPDDHLTGAGYDGVCEVYAGGSAGTGSLLTSGYHILTAAHVVTDTFGNLLPLDTISVMFNLPEGNLYIDAADVFVHPGWNGDPGHGSDLAIIVLAQAPPATVERYDIYRDDDEVGKTFEKWGFGRTGTGDTGDTTDDDQERKGRNKWETTDAVWGNSGDCLVYDFDSGEHENDALGIQYGIADLGLGDDEICAAPGDSGGPGFVNGLIAGVTSYRFYFVGASYDAVAGLNSSFGDLGADVRVSLFATWIDAIVGGSSPEFLVNSTVAGDQKWSSVAMDLDGDYVITWTSYGQDGGGNGPGAGYLGENGVYAQRFSADNTTVGDEFQVNTYTADNQQHSQVDMDADGDFMITWESMQERVGSSFTYGVYAQRYAANSKLSDPFVGANGEVGNEIHVNATTNGQQRMPGVMTSDAGDAVVAWTGQGAGDTQGVFTQRFEVIADKAGPVVSDVLTSEMDPVLPGQVVEHAVGQLVVCFGENLSTAYTTSGPTSILNPNNWELTRNGVTVNNAIKTIDFGLNKAYQFGLESLPSGKYEAVITLDGDPSVAGIQSLADGSYVLTIKSSVEDLFGNDLDGNYDGTPGGDYKISFTVLAAGSDKRVNTDPAGKQVFMDERLPIDETPNSPQSVASDADGDYGVVWRSENPANPGIFVKLYNVVWSETGDSERTSTLTEYQAINPATGLPWVNNEICVTNNPTATYASIAMDADGDFVVTWSQNDGTDVTPNWNVHAKWYDASGKAGADELQSLQLANIPLASGVTGTIRLSWNGTQTAPIAISIPSSTTDLTATAAAVESALQTAFAAQGLDVKVNVGAVTTNATAGTFDVAVAINFVGKHGELNVSELVVSQQTWTTGTAVASVTTVKEGIAGAAFRVNTETARALRYSSVAMDHDGDFVIAWQTEGQDGNGYEVYAQRYNRWAEPLDVENEIQTISFMTTPDVNFTLTWGAYTFADITFDADDPNGTQNTAAQIQAAFAARSIEVEVTAVNEVDIEVRFVGAYGNKNQPPILLGATTPAGAPIVISTLTDGKAGEFRVNQETEDDQKYASVAMDAAGSFVVTWTSTGQDGDDENETNVYARYYAWNPDTKDVVAGDAFLVNEVTDGIQRWSDVAIDKVGDFVITWTSVTARPDGEDESVGLDGTQDVFARRFVANAAGTVFATAQFGVNTTLRGTQQHSQVAMDADGDFVITWESFQDLSASGGNQPNSLGVYSQAYVRNALVAPGTNGELDTERAINGTKVRSQRLPGVALDDTGDVIIVWSGYGEVAGQEDDQGIFYWRLVQLQDVAGPTVTDVHNVAVHDGAKVLEFVEDEAVLLDEVSQFVVTFGENLDTRYLELGAHSVQNPSLWHLTKNGDPVEGAIVQVQFGLNKAYELGLSGTPSTKYEAIITFDLEALTPGLQPLDNGLYVLSIEDAVEDAFFGNPLDGNTNGAPGLDFEREFIIRVGEGGDDPVIEDDDLSNGRTNAETPGAVAGDADGDYVVTWTAFSASAGMDRVYFRRFSALGVPKSPIVEVTPRSEIGFLAGDRQGHANVAMDADGDFIISWTNYHDGNADVYARMFHGDGTAMDDPFKVNNYTIGAQKWSTVAMDADGDFVVGWSSYGQENNGDLGSGYGIYARRYDRFGHAYGPEFQVNTTTAGNQQFPSVAMDAAGAFVFVWQSDQNGAGDDIVARLYNADGSPQYSYLTGEFLVNDETAGNQRYPDVATNLAGDTFVVTWSSSQQTADQSGYGVYTKTFNRLVAGEQNVRYAYDGPPVDFTDGGAINVPIVVSQPFVIRDLNVRLTISHKDPSDLIVSLISPTGTVIRLFSEVPRQGDEDGSTASGPNGANFDRTLLDDEADVSILNFQAGALPPFDDSYRPEEVLSAVDGQQAQGVWVLRIEDRDPPYDPDVFSPDGGRLRDWSLEFVRDPAASPETLVNTTIEGNQLYSSVAMDHQGNFVVAWSGYGTQKDQEDTSQYGVFAQRFNAAAAKQGLETRLNVTTKGMQWLPSVGMDGEGNYVAVWTGDNATGDTDVYQYVSANHGLQQDLDGPIVTDVFTAVKTSDVTVDVPLLEGGVVASGLNKLVVAFGEDLSVLQVVVGGNRTPALESVLNPSNWILEREGMEILGGVSNVSFGPNTTTGRYEATLTLDNNGIGAGVAGLTPGNYVLTIRDLIKDVRGNNLDGDYDGVAGTDPDFTGHNGYKFEFHVSESGAVLGAEQRVNQSEEKVQIFSEPQGTGYAREVSTMSVAVDNDGDYVVVWTEYDQDNPLDTDVYAQLYDRDGQIHDRNGNGLHDDAPFRVNNITAGWQSNATVAMDADGDFVVVWEGVSPDGTLNVYAQRFTATGQRVANTQDQRIKEDPNYNVFGVETIEVLVNSTTVGQQFNPAVAMDSYGNYVIVWGTAAANFSYFNNLRAQRFNYWGEAVGEEFQVNQQDIPGANGPELTSSFVVNPSVAISDSGLVAFTWDRATRQTQGVVTNTEVVARVFGAGTAPLTDEFVVNDATADGFSEPGAVDVVRDARNPQIAMDSVGNFIVVFEAFLDDDYLDIDTPESYGIYYQRYDALGTPLTPGMQQANTVIASPNAGPIAGVHTITEDFAGNQVNPTIAIDADGDFAIFWNGNGAEPDPLDPTNPELIGDTDDAGVFGRWFHAGTTTVPAAPTTVQKRANETEAGVQQFPSVAMEPDGDMIVAWQGSGVGDRHGIFVRHYNQATDNAGAMITEVRMNDAQRTLLGNKGTTSHLRTVLVVFDEEVNTDMTGPGGTPGLHSVENTDNWTLTSGTSGQLEDAIDHVDFYFDATLNKWVAAVTFAIDGAAADLTDGIYTLTVSKDVYDVPGNPMGGNGLSVGGRDMSLTFIIETAPNTTPIANPGYTDAESADQVAVDADGDYVVVWTQVDAGRDRVYFRLYDANGAAKGPAQEITPATDAPAFAYDKQRFPSVAIDADGDFVVTWSNFRDTDGNGTTNVFDNADVYARRYDALGRAQGGPFRVNTWTALDQKWSSVAMDTDGDFVVTWTSKGQENGGQIGFGYGIYARRYDRFGYAYGSEFQVNTTTAGNQQLSSVDMSSDGRFVIAWQSDQDGVGDDIIARAYFADGSPAISPLNGEFRVNDTTQGNQQFPDVAFNLNGDTFVITWSSTQQTTDPDGYAVYAKTFNFQDADAQKIRESYNGPVVDFAEGQTVNIPITVTQNFVIDDLNIQLWIWHEDPSDLFVSLISPSGTVVNLFQEVPRSGDAPGSTYSGPNGQDFDGTILDDEPAPGTTVTISILDPLLAQPRYEGTYSPQEALSTFDGEGAQGTWILRVWDNDPADDPDQDPMYDTQGNIISYAHVADGGRVWKYSLDFTRNPAIAPETRVNTTTSGDQFYSSVDMDHQGNFVVTWCGYGDQKGQEDKSQYGVFAQRFNVAAQAIGAEVRLNTTVPGRQWLPSVGVDGEGRFVAVWTGTENGANAVFQHVNSVPLSTDGPIVTDVFLKSSTGVLTPLFEGGVADVGTTQLVVALGEAMSVRGGATSPAAGSILNPDNWRLSRDGVEVPGVITGVTFAENPQTGRWEATVSFDSDGLGNGVTGLAAGEYVLTLSDMATDVFGNALDGDYDGLPGTNTGTTGYDGYRFRFYVPGTSDTLGAEQRINQSTELVQILSEPKGTGYAREVTTMSIAVDNDGDYVVVWTTYGQDGDDPDETNVYYRLYDRDNNPLCDERRVNLLTPGWQGNATVAMDADGDFVVVWESKSAADKTYDIYAQRFTATGERVANERQNRLKDDPYRNRSGTVTLDGVAVPVPMIEALVNTTTVGEQFNPAVDMDSYGNYMIVWGTAGQNFGYFNNVMAQRFSFRGEPMYDEFQVNTEDMPGANGPEYTDSFLTNPSVAMNDTGLVVVAWDRATLQISGVVTNTDIYARLFDAENNPVINPDDTGAGGGGATAGTEVPEFQVNTDEILTPDDTHATVDGAGGLNEDIWRTARNPQVAMDRAGNFIVVFEAYMDNDSDAGNDLPDSYGIYYRRFDALGNPLTDEIQQANTVITDDEDGTRREASSYFKDDQVNPTIAVDADGDFAIFWNGNGGQPDPLNIENPDLVSDQDDAGVFGRWFHSGTGTVSSPTTTQQRANETEGGVQQFASVAMEPDGDTVVAWAGTGVGDRHGVFVRHYNTASDTAGPLATELRLATGGYTLVGPGDNITGNPQTLLVVFDEELNGNSAQGAWDATGLHSAENVNNWALVNGKGELLSGVITRVDHYFHTGLNKWVAEVTFSGAGLTNGVYTLVARTPIQDAAGNVLGRTGYQPYGTGRQYDADGNLIPLDSPTSATTGFGLPFSVSNTYPGSPTLDGLDQLVSTVPDVTFGEDDLGLVGYQDSSDVARNDAGDYVVVWVEYTEVISTLNMELPPNPTGGEPELAVIPAEPVLTANIMAQCFDTNGRARTEAFQVNTLALGDPITGALLVQPQPAVAIDGNGNFVVVWAGSSLKSGGEPGIPDTDIFAQRYDRDGGALGGQFRVNTYIDSTQDEPAVAMNSESGDFIVTWTSFKQDTSLDGVYGRLFHANGLPYGNEFPINTTTAGAQSASDVAMNRVGQFVVTWTSEQEASGTGIYARQFSATGAPQSGEIHVNTYTNGNQVDPAVAMNKNGQFVVTWASPQDGSGLGVYAQRFAANGTAQGAEMPVNLTKTHDQFQPDIAMSETGGKNNEGVFTIVWTSFNQDTIPYQEYVRDWGVFARSFNLDGTDYSHAVAGVVREFRINAETDGNQYEPAIAMEPEGHYVVTWTGLNTMLTTYVENPDAAGGGGGTGGGTTEEFLPVDKPLTAIYSRYIDPPPAAPTGSVSLVDVVISGTSGNDVFEFLGGQNPSLWIVKLNGVVQTIPSNVATLRFDGKAGQDTVLFTGSSADDVVEFWTGRAAMTSFDYSVAVENVETITATGGGGEDIAVMHDSSGDDTFTGSPDAGVMTGTGFTHRAEAFESVKALADAGGSDVANLYDSPGDDTFTATPASAQMAGADYQIQADGFEFAKGYSYEAGIDVANLYDSVEDDKLVATATYAKLYNDEGFYALATGFSFVRVYATAGGRDTATMYGSDGNDTFTAGPTYAKFQGANFYNRADCFEVVNADGHGGNDKAYLYDSAGDDVFVAGYHFGQMSGPEFQMRADFFRWVYGYCYAGGNDVARVYDSAGDDHLYVTKDYAELYGDAYLNRAFGFDRVDARATNGGYDEATLNDSALNDYLEAEDDWARLANTQLGFAYWASQFDHVTARSNNDGDTKRVAPAIDFVLAAEGMWRDE